MKLFTLTVFAVTLYTAAGLADIGEVIFKKYAMMKIFEDCYGKEAVKGMFREIRSACAKCKGSQVTRLAANEESMNLFNAFGVAKTEGQQTPQAALPPFVKVSPEMLRAALGYSQQLQYAVPYHAYMRHPVMEDLPPQFYNFRQKREAVDPEVKVEAHAKSPNPALPPSLAKLQELRFKIQAKVSNVTCIMQELGFLDQDLQPNYENIRNRVRSYPISEDLKKDLCEGIDTCKDFSTCLPQKNFEKMPMFQHLAKPFVFFKCFKGKKLMSCMKKDLREKFGELLAEDQMMMARTFGNQNLDVGEMDPEEMTTNVFQNIYGFDFNSDVDIF